MTTLVEVLDQGLAGWDDGLETFFIQGCDFDTVDDETTTCPWYGTSHREMLSPWLIPRVLEALFGLHPGRLRVDAHVMEQLLTARATSGVAARDGCLDAVWANARSAALLAPTYVRTGITVTEHCDAAGRIVGHASISNGHMPCRPDLLQPLLDRLAEDGLLEPKILGSFHGIQGLPTDVPLPPVYVWHDSSAGAVRISFNTPWLMEMCSRTASGFGLTAAHPVVQDATTRFVKLASASAKPATEWLMRKMGERGARRG